MIQRVEMKKFGWIKTIQLVLFILLTAAALAVIFRDNALYQEIASDPHVRALCLILWFALGLSFLFMLMDFGMYSGLKRENLELDQAIHLDMLTGVANRNSCDAFISKYRRKKMPGHMGCVTLVLLNLADINEELGHDSGDAALRDFAEILTQSAKVKGAPEGETSCFIGRNGGNRFLAIFRSCSHELLSDFLLEVERLIGQRETEGKCRLIYAVGTAFDEDSSVNNLAGLVALSDRRAARDQSHRK